LENTGTAITSGDNYGQIEWEGNDYNTSANGIRASIQVKGHGAGTQGEVAMYFRTSYVGADSNVDRMIIDHIGNVGIGTTSPNQVGYGGSSKVLSLKANSSGGECVLELIGLGNADNDQVGVLNFMSQAETTPLASIKGLRYTSDTSGKLTFETSAVERMRIDNTPICFVSSPFKLKFLTLTFIKSSNFGVASTMFSFNLSSDVAP
ncbi:unnamed protein product, partial [marine sediment metagenome]